MRFIRRVLMIVIDPRTEWRRIAQEPGDVMALFMSHVAVLALVPPLAGFVGAVVVGVVDADGAVVRSPVFTALLGAIFGYAASFLIVIAMALVVDVLAPRFGGRKDFGAALKLAAYAMTPVWLAGLFLVVPGLRFLSLLGFYAAYLAWTGLPPLMQAPPQRTLAYAVAVVACGWVLAVLAAATQQALFAGPGGI